MFLGKAGDQDLGPRCFVNSLLAKTNSFYRVHELFTLTSAASASSVGSQPPPSSFSLPGSEELTTLRMTKLVY
jgi:hypothetical protein